ncbi:MAG: sulfite exporter TauE/SafE family protein [Candidatus Nitrosopolaris sp.]
MVIGLVGGMVGLVLGVVRFPVVMSVETSVSITAGTNLGVSTLGAITAAVRHYRQRNIQLRAFLVLGITGAAGASSCYVFLAYWENHHPLTISFLSTIFEFSSDINRNRL